MSCPLHIIGIPKSVVTNTSSSQAMAQIDGRLKRIEQSIPIDLKPWSPDYTPINFVDALDGCIQLPFEWVSNYKVITSSTISMPANN